MANEVLKQYNTTGLLIGGLAKEMWRGSSDPEDFAKHKDVDVLILSHQCENHPTQWEAGVDWWVRHSLGLEHPTNGGSVGVIWRLRFNWKDENRVRPGLYICPMNVLKTSIKQEKIRYGDDFKVKDCKFKKEISPLNEFPIMPNGFLRVRWGRIGNSARHCKPYYQ